MKKKLLIFVVLITMLSLFTGCTNLQYKKLLREDKGNNVAIDYVDFNPSNYNDLVGYNDYIIVAKVEEFLDNNKAGKNEATPKMFFKIKVIENIKGKLETEKSINIYVSGGLEKLDAVIISTVPKINNYYIFSFVCDKNKSLEAQFQTSVIEVDKDYKEYASYKEVIKSLKTQKVYERTRYKSIYDIS